MGLNDREYMREVPEYRRITGRGGGDKGGSSTPRAPASGHSLGIAMYVWILLGVLALVAGGYVYKHRHQQAPSSSPLVVPRTLIIRTSPHRVVLPTRRVGLIRGTRLLGFGGSLTLSGQAAPVPGAVRVLGRWNAGPWQTFAVANANGTRYHFTFPLDHRGVLRLRVVQPNGYVSVATYRVS